MAHCTRLCSLRSWNSNFCPLPVLCLASLRQFFCSGKTCPGKGKQANLWRLIVANLHPVSQAKLCDLLLGGLMTLVIPWKAPPFLPTLADANHLTAFVGAVRYSPVASARNALNEIRRSDCDGQSMSESCSILPKVKNITITKSQMITNVWNICNLAKGFCSEGKLLESMRKPTKEKQILSIQFPRQRPAKTISMKQSIEPAICK